MHKYKEIIQANKDVWLSYFLIIFAAYCFSFLFTHLLLTPVYVEGNSMSPQIENGTIGFSNIASFRLFGIKRFDIVLLKRDNGEIWVKRVIALPNETIEVKDHILYIDGIAYEETFLSSDIQTDDFKPLQVGEHMIFVMGDNRNASYDSRMVGPVSTDQIISKDVYALYE